MWRNLELCGHGQPLFRGETTQGHVWAVMIVAAYEHYTKKTRLTLRHAIYPASCGANLPLRREGDRRELNGTNGARPAVCGRAFRR